MKRISVLLTALLLALAAGSVAAQGEKTPEIKEIMGKLNKPTGLYFALGADLKDETPPWAGMQQPAKDVARLAAALGKNKPPKGDAEAWQQLTKEYAANAAALEKAVAAQDKATAKAAYDKMGGQTCTMCHKAHKN